MSLQENEAWLDRDGEHVIGQTGHHDIGLRLLRARGVLDMPAQVVGHDGIIVRRMRQRAFRQA